MFPIVLLGWTELCNLTEICLFVCLLFCPQTPTRVLGLEQP